MRVQELLTTTPLTVAQVEEICQRHTGLDALALAELAPIAANGHAAHLVLFIAAKAKKWAAGDQTPPAFVTRARLAASMTWEQAEECAEDTIVRVRLEEHRLSGEIATAHLVRLAEGMIRRIVKQLRLRQSARTTVVDLADMINTGRAAVAQGVWAYDPARPSGPHYLRAWIEEHVKRDLAGLTYQVSIPAKTQARFLRMVAIRASLCEQLGRNPSDAEMLARPDAAFTQADLDDERRTRMRRRHAGLGMRSLMPGRGTRTVEADSGETLLLRPATHDRSDTTADDWEEDILQQVDDHSAPETSGWRAALDVLQLGPVQREIIARAMGLPPHERLPGSDRSERAIAARLGLKRCTVRKVITTLRTEMSKPGGRLHHLLARLSDEDREGLGLQRFAGMFGPLAEGAPLPEPVPQVLTQPLSRHGAGDDFHGLAQRRRVVVRYECRGDCGWTGHETAPSPRLILAAIRCPDCGEAATASWHRAVG
ncbi:hypothetical protein M8C13_32450 [Crossiella sp. SN42]|uniref:hypothetical protein n=1 Tax=Crossiella sp. SN42 TaxID=2944808 RepID=UPI00207C8F97|nr:hypothetical protein [Crossiella sp. SN42]MCO1580475.1 hypothetical protein [Crossiella sp. SN42]